MIKAIIAVDTKGGVSKDGRMPWSKNPRDLQHFKELTTGQTVIMGSKTWNAPDMPAPLPNRHNIVFTRRALNYSLKEGKKANQTFCGDAIDLIKTMEPLQNGRDMWIIGGPNIIEQCLDIIEEFHISRIPGIYECDTFLDLTKVEEKFKLVSSEEHFEVTFEIWKRKNEAVS